MKKGAIWAIVGCLLLGLSACGRSSPTVPGMANVNANGKAVGEPPDGTGPTVKVSSSKEAYFVGETEIFTASLKRSDGSTVPITGGTWASDTPAVATVTDEGLVSVVGQGWVNISCTFNGLTGAKQIWGRVDIRGAWSGTYSIRRCELWEDFHDANFCETHGGSGLPVSLVLTKEEGNSWDALHGTITLGDRSVPVVAVPLLDGSLEMEGEFPADPYVLNVAIGADYTPAGPKFCMMLYYFYPGKRSSGQAILTCDISLSKTGAGL